MISPHTVAHSLDTAAASLAGLSDSPRLDAEVLLGAVLGLGRSQLIVRAGEPVEIEALRRYQQLIERRQTGAPVAYLTGTREFWSLRLTITPAVLVPRPETEKLVELALERVAPRAAASILDLGTGSGAIALALATERPQARITATDVSPQALDVARGNASALGLGAIAWRQGSWFEAVRGERFQVIVANPPYVAAGDPALENLGAEPRLALVSGPTGLDALRAIIAGAPAHLEEGGVLLLEHGCDQAGEVARLLGACGFHGVSSHTDHSGKPRVTLGTHHLQH